MAEHSQPAAPFPSSISSERKPGGSVTAGAKRGWRGKVGYEQQLCVSHSVSLPCFPLWEASRKQICESHLDLPHIPELCPVPAEEELLVTASQGQWEGQVLPQARFFSCPGTACRSVPLGAGAAAGFTLLGSSHTQCWHPSVCLSVVLTHVAHCFCLSLC